MPASITVAEIKGSEHPEERVIVGGHLDSWDLGQGALDNGTGAMATLEAARTLQALGWKPKRTITFILFTGEEQGGIGADTFLKNHAAEIPTIDAVLILDTGTGKVFSIALENLWETAPLMHEIYQPLQEVFDLQPLSTRYFGSSDHVPVPEQRRAGLLLHTAAGAISRGAPQPDRHLRQGDSRPNQRRRSVAGSVGVERFRDAAGAAASSRAKRADRIEGCVTTRHGRLLAVTQLACKVAFRRNATGHDFQSCADKLFILDSCHSSRALAREISY